MGIPLHYEPPASRSDSNAKRDPTAPSRSTIRRHRIIRHPTLRNRTGTVDSRHSRRSPTFQISEQFDRDARLEPRLGQHSSRNSSSLGGESRLDWPPVPSSMSSIERRELGQRLVRDALRYASPGRRMRIPRESSLRFEMSNNPGSTMDSHPPLPGRPTSFRFHEHPPFSPRFAPAYPTLNQSSDVINSTSSTARPTERSNPQHTTRARTGAGPEDYGHVSYRVPHHLQLDGLGDRERSLSPSDESDEHDPWETLLTTIRPDDNLPSADSSFTSATATASSALSRNTGRTSFANSSRTSLPTLHSPMFPLEVDSFPDLIAHCDEFMSEDSDTEADSDMEHEPYRRPNIIPREPTSRSTSRPDPETASRSNDTGSSTPSANVSFGLDDGTQGLQQLQDIIDRLARRGDIPDEWWAAIGLSRNLGRGVSDVPPRSNEQQPREHL
ncbi:hypothetical protein AJ80_02971 [Polytolypa hystricis UAMH7299]|uniref:Uncharacterized protein n=1 Tax=Polytolypa hystricis (strain UAMH7299) TaxID=1447883 RepID=A0A2B7YPZ1_POLH7|nr:hypothetical protein AJ80_02971 [Polytolypa hystricis UAMH7299]